MNRRKILTKEVDALNMSNVENQLLENSQMIAELMEKFFTRDLSITDANIGVDRKLLYSWKKHELLPFAQKEKSWGRFSFVEVCWLKLLLELRSVGVGLDKLREVKEFFFPKNFVNDFFTKSETEFPNKELEKEIKEKIEFKDGKPVFENEHLDILKEASFSLFTSFLLATILTRSNYCIYIDSNGKIDALELNALLNDPIENLQSLFDQLSNNTVVFVNLKKIIADLSGTHEHFSKNLGFGTLMSENSVSSLKNLFLSNQIDEITIRVNQSGRPTVRIKKYKSFDQLKKEVEGLKKKGTFKDMLIKTRDGNIQYFEQIELVKL